MNFLFARRARLNMAMQLERRPILSFVTCFIPLLILLSVLFSVFQPHETLWGDAETALNVRIQLFQMANVGRKSVVYGRRTAELAFARAGFTDKVEDDSWHYLWTLNPQTRHLIGDIVEQTAPTHPRVHNHCNYFMPAGQKCQFAGHVSLMRRQLGEQGLDCHLEVYRWRGDSERSTFFKRYNEDPPTKWVQKPCTMSRGRGIQFIERKPGEIATEDSRYLPDLSKSYVFQRNIDNAMLMDNHKFHVRVYLTITSYNPVRVSLYNEGLMFTAAKDIKAAAEGDYDALLSNRAVSRSSRDSRLSWFWEHVGEERASKMRTRLRRALAQLVALYPTLSEKVQLIGSLNPYPSDYRVTCDLDPHSGESADRAKKFGCFDTFGVDIMFDANDNPFILELNSGASMESPVPPSDVLDRARALKSDAAGDALFPANEGVKRQLITDQALLARRFIEGVRMQDAPRMTPQKSAALTHDMCIDAAEAPSRFCALYQGFVRARCGQAASAARDVCQKELSGYYVSMYHHRVHANHQNAPDGTNFSWFNAANHTRVTHPEGIVNGFQLIYPRPDVDQDLYDMWKTRGVVLSRGDQIMMEWARYVAANDATY